MAPDPTAATLSFHELESQSGLFAFADPCELDDGMGMLEGEGLLEHATQALNHVRFAHGAGRYRLDVHERVCGDWGNRVVRMELQPVGDPPVAPADRDWQSIGWVAIDTGTCCAFDPERLSAYAGPLEYDDLFCLGRGNHGTLPKQHPFLASMSSGFGDGGYDVEVDGPPEAARAMRIVFIDESAL